MRVHIKGKGQVDLNNNDFLAEGGQGKVYSKGNLVYKVYHDPKKMIPDGKVTELAALTFPNIIKPEDLLVNGKGQVIGYTMKHVPDAHPLCKVFTKAFRQREKVSEQDIVKMVQRMRETVAHVHDKHVLIVDLNEMNFLCDKHFGEVYFLDVDSYMTPHFPATALMESVRDRHMKPNQFDQGTDWFAFGIVSFQLFIGIHPYKGKHPNYHDIDTRMLKNVSVLNPDVSVPAVCYPFTNIPKAYLDWYKAVFEDGKRVPPPTDMHGVIVIAAPKVQTVSGSNNFDIAEMGKYKGEVIDYYFSAGVEVVVTTDRVYVNGRETTYNVTPVFGFTPKQNKPLAAYAIGNGLVEIIEAVGQQVKHTCGGRDVMAYENRLYVLGDMGVLEVGCFEGKDLFVNTTHVANVLEKATKMYDGVVVQNLLGSYYLSFFPKPGHHQQVAVPELNGYQVVDAKFQSGVLMVMGAKGGKYDRLVFRFDEQWKYDLTVRPDVTLTGINFVVLDSGACVCINEEEKVEVFSARKDGTHSMVIDDPAINSNMRLFRRAGKVVFGQGDKVFSMTMRKKP